MSPSPAGDIVFRLDTIDQLFNAPDINPFSSEQIDMLGEPAITLIVRRLMVSRSRNWKGVKLVLKLPADQITPDLEAQTREALRRHAAAKIEDNRLQIRLSRVRSLIGLSLVTAISIVVVAVAYVLLNNVFTTASQIVRGIAVATISVFVWVILWDPMEQLFFGWVEPRLENNALRKLQNLEIVVQPKS